VITLRIEHSVPDVDAWRRAFDADPLDRRGSGVRRYRVMSSLDEPSNVLVDLDFDTPEEAEAMRVALQRMWARVEREGLIGEGRAHIAEILETTEL
jgi:hypothetical protein